MLPAQTSKPFRHFAKHLFLVSLAYTKRNKARDAVYSQLQNMRKAIIGMRLSYTDIDKLKEKIDDYIDLERKCARFFRPEDTEIIELKKQVALLEQGIRSEREEKQRILNENDEKISQLKDSLDSIKIRMNHLFMDRARRHHRLKALEQKINEKVDVHSFYHS